ncbi:plastocyanin/azurin family copper-binding protein [Devosia nitrariae]|uniref:Halocyanin n=1 Tax=Devosia nitrariae TaxID=2071872 RepID=A0ABQ5WB62_9HYPH|nr:plastocyanin/azurin family copper-binding protein [Devosia nitrariae]GLQ57049.1 halocyanin [Devosia nitrariae]
MSVRRRRLVAVGAGILAGLVLRPLPGLSAGTVEVAMQGGPDGSHVWFDPVGIHVRPGETVRWTNRDPGNSHTATAYHPSLDGHPLRIPNGAEPWNSDYLLPDESFEVTLTVEGVYDYYCIPHEHAGMAGRIVVGMPRTDQRPSEGGLPEGVLESLPDVAEIISAGTVHP